MWLATLDGALAIHQTALAVLALQTNYQEETMKQLERLDDLTDQYDVLFCDVWGVWYTTAWPLIRLQSRH